MEFKKMCFVVKTIYSESLNLPDYKNMLLVKYMNSIPWVKYRLT